MNFSKNAFDSIIRPDNQKTLFWEEADMVIFYSVYFDDDRDVLAYAYYCEQIKDYYWDKEASRRVKIGRVMINLSQITLDTNN